MSSDAAARAAPLTAAGQVVARETDGLELHREDLGAFRATLADGEDLAALRPTDEGLVAEWRDVREVVPWDAVTGLSLTYAEAGHAQVPAVRVLLASGPSLDFADGLAPGAAALPASIAPG